MGAAAVFCPMSSLPYVGRFAPSPSGPLHAGSLVAALASYLDARAHGGRWLIRIEDLDTPRNVAGADDAILRALAAFGMESDGEVLWQSRRHAQYQAALTRLGALVYPCGCSRREIADSIGAAPRGGDGAAIYPGTCRAGLAPGKVARAWRLRVPEAGQPGDCIAFDDRWQGPQQQCLSREVGDFVLKRADGIWAYQLAVVVDDAAQGITQVVRGADLLDSTARQIHLQRLLGLPTPAYLHLPLVRNGDGDKLSKQTGAAALDLTRPLQELEQAARFLGLRMAPAASLEAFWRRAPTAWGERLAALERD